MWARGTTLLSRRKRPTGHIHPRPLDSGLFRRLFNGVTRRTLLPRPTRSHQAGRSRASSRLFCHRLTPTAGSLAQDTDNTPAQRGFRAGNLNSLNTLVSISISRRRKLPRSCHSCEGRNTKEVNSSRQLWIPEISPSPQPSPSREREFCNRLSGATGALMRRNPSSPPDDRKVLGRATKVLARERYSVGAHPEQQHPKVCSVVSPTKFANPPQYFSSGLPTSPDQYRSTISSCSGNSSLISAIPGS